MPSPADIPEHLLEADKWPEFVVWVNSLEIPPPDRKELGNFWSTYAGVRLTREQWREIVPADW